MIPHFVAKHDSETHAGATCLSRVEFGAETERIAIGRCRLLSIVDEIHDESLVPLIDIPVNLEGVKVVEGMHVDEAD